MANPTLQKIIKLTQAQYDILDAGGTVGDYTGLNDNYLYLIQSDDAPMIFLTWASLKSLRDSGQLVPGQQYRITDYQCTTTQANTSSAGHQFDIIVVADDSWTLNEKARAVTHANDAYFDDNNLNAWQLWYCLSNDTSRFAWADDTNGKGVIYRMIDEFGNDVPYDFKNIIFTTQDASQNTITSYTFCYISNNNIYDATVGNLRRANFNIIKPYIVSLDNRRKQQLNGNICRANSGITIANNNIFESQCYDNRLLGKCENNYFGMGCYSNIISGSSDNYFSNTCYSNQLTNSLNNQFGNGCSSNTLSGSNAITLGVGCNSNTFGNGSGMICFGDRCSTNQLGARNQMINFGMLCCSNTFGTDCAIINFGNNCSSIAFGTASTAINYCKHIIVDTGCSYLNINSTDTDANSNNLLRYIHIHAGVSGSDATDRQSIIVPDRNLKYSTDYYAHNSTNVILDAWSA